MNSNKKFCRLKRKRTRIFRSLITLGLLLVGAAPSHATLNIMVHLPTETFTLSGSLEGTPLAEGGLPELQYGVSNIGFGINAAFIPLDSAITFSPNAPFAATLLIDDGGVSEGVALEFGYIPDPGTEQTITSISPAVSISYASIDADLKTIFETFALDGAELVATTGISSDSVTLIAVPEPATYGLIFGGLVLMLPVVRRRR